MLFLSLFSSLWLPVLALPFYSPSPGIISKMISISESKLKGNIDYRSRNLKNKKIPAERYPSKCSQRISVFKTSSNITFHSLPPLGANVHQTAKLFDDPITSVKCTAIAHGTWLSDSLQAFCKTKGEARPARGWGKLTSAGLLIKYSLNEPSTNRTDRTDCCSNQ